MGVLKGKAAIITGASSGVGRETAYELAKEGCNLVITARREERLKEVAAKCEALGVKVVYTLGDAREEQTAIETVKACVENFGKVDILINNAGIGRAIKLVDTTMKDYEEIMDSNVRSAFAFTRYAIPEMLKQHKGQVVMVSSVTGVYGHTDEAVYTASKFALRGMAQAIDKELFEEGIKAAVLCPSAIATEFEVGHGRTEEELADRKWLTPKEVAEAIAFVCTRPDNSRIMEVRLASMTCPVFA